MLKGEFALNQNTFLVAQVAFSFQIIPLVSLLFELGVSKKRKGKWTAPARIHTSNIFRKADRLLMATQR